MNIKNDHGKAKAYQVRQVLAAVDKIDEMRADSTESETKEEGK